MMERKSRIETTPRLLGSNCANTRSNAATSSSRGESGSSLSELDADEGEALMEVEETERTYASLSFAIVARTESDPIRQTDRRGVYPGSMMDGWIVNCG